LADCSPKQKTEKTGKKGGWLRWLIGQLLSQTKKGEDRKERPPLAIDLWINQSQKRTETGKGGQDMVNQPTALPN